MKEVKLKNEKTWQYFTELAWHSERPLDSAMQFFVEDVQKLPDLQVMN